MSDVAITFVVLGAVVVGFVWNRFPVELVAVGASVALYLSGVLEPEQVLAGLGDPTVIFIASLFVVSEALDATGITAWVGQELGRRMGTSRTRQVVLTMGLCALLTALVSPNGSVAALVPMVVVLALRLGRSPSEILLPLAFAAHAGSLLALTGTPVNVIVADAAADSGAGTFGFFSVTVVGVPLLLGTIGVVLVLGPRLLPDRSAAHLPTDLSDHAETLARQYALQQSLYRLRVRGGSPFVGRAEGEIDLDPYEGVELIGVQRGGSGPPVSGSVVSPGDVLVARGERDAIDRLSRAYDLALSLELESADGRLDLLSSRSGVVEVVVAPRSPLIGQRAFPGMVTESGGLVILAVQRRGEDVGPEESVLAAGDSLLLQGPWEDLGENVERDPAVLVVDPADQVRRQALPLGPGALRALVALGGMVVLLATGVMPAAMAGLIAASAVVLLRVLTPEQAYRSISWTTVLLIGGMIPLSVAMQETGAAEQVAEGLVRVVGESGPYALLIGLFTLTVVLGQLISNTATALIVVPIAVSAAVELDVSPLPILMAVNVAAAASVLTPVATPANLMVMGPGGYRFGDYWKLGLPVLAVYVAVAVLLVPRVWAF